MKNYDKLEDRIYLHLEAFGRMVLKLGKETTLADFEFHANEILYDVQDLDNREGIFAVEESEKSH